jgi:hypothetical protein
VIVNEMVKVFAFLRALRSRGFCVRDSRFRHGRLPKFFVRGMAAGNREFDEQQLWCLLGRHDPGSLIDKTPDLGFEASPGR